METATQQIDRLADFIMQNIPGEPSQSEGAVDTAIRLLGAAAQPGEREPVVSLAWVCDQLIPRIIDDARSEALRPLRHAIEGQQDQIASAILSYHRGSLTLSEAVRAIRGTPDHE